MPHRKPAQPVGGDIDWFVIPIERIRRRESSPCIVIVAALGGYFLYTRMHRSPAEKREASWRAP